MGRTGPRCRPELASDAREVPTSAPMRPRLPPAVGWRGRGRGSRRAGRAARPSGSVTCIRQPHHSGQWHWRPAGRPRSPSPSASAWSPPGPGVSGCQGEGPAQWGSCMPRGGGGGDRALALPERGGGGSGRPWPGPRLPAPGPVPDPAVPDFGAGAFSSPVTCHLRPPESLGRRVCLHSTERRRHTEFPQVEVREARAGPPVGRRGARQTARRQGGGLHVLRRGLCPAGSVPCGQVQWGPGATPAGPTRPGTGVGKSTFPI